MVIESQYILALYNQKGPPGRTLSTPLVLYTTASETSGSPCFMAEVYFEPPDVLGQSLETFDCSSYCLCLCILGTVFLFLCSPPVSARPLLCAGVPAPLSSRGVPSSCKPPPSALSPVSCPGHSRDSLTALCPCEGPWAQHPLLLGEVLVPSMAPRLSWRTPARWLGFSLWNCNSNHNNWGAGSSG